MDAMGAISPDSTTAATLRRFTQRPRKGQSCEFCSEELAAEHRHVLEISTRKIVCACTACALRFENGVGKWKLIPRNPRRLSGFQMTADQWEALSLPINLAFFCHSTPIGKVIALYPSPAGATESLLPLYNWEMLTAQNPSLKEMTPDVEALLANRLNERGEYYIAPIDLCYELVGLIRLHWRGLSGGERVWEEIKVFFDRLGVVSSEVSTG
jgi:hypothetical protein